MVATKEQAGAAAVEALTDKAIEVEINKLDRMIRMRNAARQELHDELVELQGRRALLVEQKTERLKAQLEQSQE